MQLVDSRSACESQGHDIFLLHSSVLCCAFSCFMLCILLFYVSCFMLSLSTVGYSLGEFLKKAS